jgi:hypothetical protein
MTACMPTYECVCLPPDGGGVALQQESLYEARQDRATQRLPVHRTAHLNCEFDIKCYTVPEHVEFQRIVQ